MRLLCDEERIPQQGAMLLGTLEQAAVLCLKEEGIPDERVEISLSFKERAGEDRALGQGACCTADRCRSTGTVEPSQLYRCAV